MGRTTETEEPSRCGRRRDCGPDLRRLRGVGTLHSTDSPDQSLLPRDSWLRLWRVRILLVLTSLEGIYSQGSYGARVSILVGVLTIAISMAIGVGLGLIAGYFRGAFDKIMSRFTDLLLAFPYLIFVIGMMSVLGPGFWNLIFALCFKGWVEFYRLTRAEVMSQKTCEYVEAARSLGRSDWAIMVSEILPNIIHSILVLGTLRMGNMIVMESSLSFLGLGIPPRIPAWGSMVSDGRRYMLNAWWVATLPGLALVILVLAINPGEGLRDVLDPKLQEG